MCFNWKDGTKFVLTFRRNMLPPSSRRLDLVQVDAEFSGSSECVVVVKGLQVLWPIVKFTTSTVLVICRPQKGHLSDLEL